MFKIGDFSKLSRVPVKTLRYYDEIGLLKPSGIDRFTRYRYYSAEQLLVLYRILGLKELGFSLEQIARLLEGDLSPDQVRKMLEAKRTEVQQQVQATQAQLTQIEARLEQLERQGRLPHAQVIVKQVPPQWVATATDNIASFDQVGEVVERLFEEVCGYIAGYGCRLSVPGIVLYHDPDPSGETTRIEAAMPLPRSVPSSEKVRVYELPGIESMASLVHQGNISAIGEAYQALLSWVQTSGSRICGPLREVYLHVPPRGSGQEWVVEIQAPLRKFRKEMEMKEPKITSLKEFKVVGMPYLGKNEQSEISQIWQEFLPRLAEIQHLVSGPEASYGLCSPNPQGLIDYIAGVQVTRLEDIPQGMVGREVPAQTYVVFESRGIDDIGPTYQTILKEWLPSSDYQPGDGPDFEYYTSSFNPDDPESVLLIYFPIKKP